MKRFSFIERILLQASRFNMETCLQCSAAEIQSKTIAGSLVLVSTLLSFTSFYVGMWYQYDSHLAGVLSGSFFGLLVYIIDGAIIAYGRKVGAFITIVRGSLSVSLGALASTLFLIFWFQASINVKLDNNNLNKITSVQDSYNPKIDTLHAQIRIERNKISEEYDAVKGEADGTSGSGRVGVGEVTKFKQGLYNEEKSRSTQAITRLEGQISILTEEREDKIRSIKGSRSNDILASYMALMQLHHENSAARLAIYVLHVLFILLDISPLLVKVTKTGIMPEYEMIQDADSRRTMELHTIKRDSKLKVDILRLQADERKECKKVELQEINSYMAILQQSDETFYKHLVASIEKRKDVEKMLGQLGLEYTFEQEMREEIDKNFSKSLDELDKKRDALKTMNI